MKQQILGQLMANDASLLNVNNLLTLQVDKARRIAEELQTETKKVVEGLCTFNESYNPIKTIGSLINEAMFEIDMQGTILSLNTMASYMFGIKELPANIKDFIKVEIKNQYRTRVKGFTKDDHILTLDVSMSCLTDGRAIVVVRDITKEQEHQLQIRNQNDILKAVSYIARKFIQYDFQDAMPKAMERLRVATHSHRAFIYEIDESGFFMFYNYEVVANNITSYLNKEPDNLFKCESCIKKLSNYEILIFDEQQIKECSVHGSTCIRPLDVKSSILVPMFINNSLIGFIGLDDCRSNRMWSPAEIEALNSAASIFSSVFEQEQIKVQTEKDRIRTKGLTTALNHSTDAILLIKADVKTIEYMNPTFESLFNLDASKCINKSIEDLLSIKIEDVDNPTFIDSHKMQIVPIRNGGQIVRYYLLIRKK